MYVLHFVFLSSQTTKCKRKMEIEKANIKPAKAQNAIQSRNIALIVFMFRFIKWKLRLLLFCFGVFIYFFLFSSSHFLISCRLGCSAVGRIYCDFYFCSYFFMVWHFIYSFLIFFLSLLFYFFLSSIHSAYRLRVYIHLHIFITRNIFISIDIL